MYTRFEEFAAAELIGTRASPPRVEGRLRFNDDWERSLFGMTLALAKNGVFEWEDFRQYLIVAIAEWEQTGCESKRPWDYYACFYQALVALLLERQVIDDPSEFGLSARM